MCIGGLALLLRLFHLTQIEGLVSFYHLMGDANAYDAWGQRIAGGQWWGPETFYQAPLYPYFLGLVYSLFGHDVWLVGVIQCVLGATSCVVLAVAGAKFFSRRAGLLAGFLVAIYPPAIFFDGIIQKTSFGLFLFAVFLLLLAFAIRGSSRLWFPVGLALGLTALTRENALALAPVMALWLLLRGRFRSAVAAEPGSQATSSTVLKPHIRGLSVLLFGCGLLVALSPAMIHNYVVGGELTFTTFQMGPNFYMGNQKDAVGLICPLIPGRETPEYERADATALAEAAVGRELTPQEVSNFWLGQALEYITSQPLDWLQLLGRKWWMTWNRYEIPDTESYYIHRERSWVLGVLGRVLHFGVLCPLAAAGVVLTWTKRRSLMPLYLVALTVAAGVTLFYVSARYRFPLVAVAAPFAAAGIVEWVWRFRAGDRRRVALPTVVAVVSAVWVNWPISREKELNAAQWGNLGAAWAATGEIDRALPCFQRAVGMHPDAPRLRQFMADALSFAGRYEEAIGHYRALLALDPTWPNAHFNLGFALERVGRYDEALRSYRLALLLDPHDVPAARAIERLSGHK